MDLLRVLAMLMIVFNHLVYHGVQHVPAASAGAMSQMSVHAVQANFLVLQFLAYSSLVATNIFFLITGYFLVKPREISYAVGKSFKLWRVIVFYSLTIYAGLCALLLLAADHWATDAHPQRQLLVYVQLPGGSAPFPIRCKGA